MINFVEILENAAARFPSKTALIIEDTSISYSELYMLVNSVARGLVDVGITPGDRIVCLLPNGIEIILSHFAAAKIGATLAPLDPALDQNSVFCRIAEIKPDLLIVEHSLNHLFEGVQDIPFGVISTAGIGGITFGDLINAFPRIDFRVEIDTGNPCSILYTHGHGGFPRAVYRSYENNYWAAICMALHLNTKPGDIELMVAPMHSVAFYNHFLPNVIGGATVILEDGFHLHKVCSAIERFAVTRLYLNPHLWRMLVWTEEFYEYDSSSVQAIIVGESPCPIEGKKRLSRIFGKADFYEIYSMAEGGLIGIEPDEVLQKLGSIGKPLCFHEADIVDEFGFKVAPGDVGEIVLRGKTVASKYLEHGHNNQEIDCYGWLHTGDLARYDYEGYIYLVGKRSELILSGVDKIFASEVEDALNMHPDVMESIVFAYPDMELRKIVVAAVRKQPGSTLLEGELISYTLKYIPAYQKPRVIIFVDDNLVEFKHAKDKLVRKYGSKIEQRLNKAGNLQKAK